LNIKKYREDLEKLARRGKILLLTMATELKFNVTSDLDAKEREKLPPFNEAYQAWYSEALAAIRQLLPDRVEDFIAYYKSTKPRKDITYANYTISDYLQGLNITRGYYKDKVVGPDAAFPPLQQQVQIIEAMKNRFESTLFDIQSLVQADFFDSELDVSVELNGKGFSRAAGAVAGVALEGHLASIAAHHKLTVPKNHTISILNDALKKADVIDVPTWRFIQRLGDLRNLCDHKREVDPSKDDIDELIDGTRKIIKTIF
jgi:hypothetical protein